MFSETVWIELIDILPDGNLLICGYTNPPSFERDGFLALADSEGRIQWEQKYDDPAGNIGDTSWDSSYFYVKTIDGWKRAALETWSTTER